MKFRYHLWLRLDSWLASVAKPLLAHRLDLAGRGVGPYALIRPVAQIDRCLGLIYNFNSALPLLIHDHPHFPDHIRDFIGPLPFIISEVEVGDLKHLFDLLVRLQLLGALFLKQLADLLSLGILDPERLGVSRYLHLLLSRHLPVAVVSPKMKVYEKLFVPQHFTLSSRRCPQQRWQLLLIQPKNTLRLVRKLFECI